MGAGTLAKVEEGRHSAPAAASTRPSHLPSSSRESLSCTWQPYIGQGVMINKEQSTCTSPQSVDALFLGVAEQGASVSILALETKSKYAVADVG